MNRASFPSITASTPEWCRWNTLIMEIDLEDVLKMVVLVFGVMIIMISISNPKYSSKYILYLKRNSIGIFPFGNRIDLY